MLELFFRFSNLGGDLPPKNSFYTGTVTVIRYKSLQLRTYRVNFGTAGLILGR